MKNWEEQFDWDFVDDEDKRFWASKVRVKEVKQFISDLLAERYHDHKILVNSILDIKNKELKERDEKLKARDEKWETAVRYNVEHETWKRIERAIKALKN